MKKEIDSNNKIQRGGELSSGPTKRESFVVYTSLANHIRFFSYEDIGRLFCGILGYAKGEEKDAVLENLPDNVKIAFSFVSDQMDVNFEKYDQICEKKRKAANKRWGKSEGDARASSALHNDNDNDTENENENENENEKKEEINSSSSSSNNDSDGVAEEEEDEEEKILKFSKKGALGWMSLFKDLVETNESRIPPPKIMTLERARGLYQLIKKFGRETVANVFRKAAQTSFLNGKGKNKFVASFDWLLIEKNFVNVYEGKFFC